MGAIDTYVADLGAAVRGPRRARADLLTETRDSLIDATEAYEQAGLDRVAAERRAIDEFGRVEQIAPAYQAELGVAQGRRTAVVMLLALLPQPFVWNLSLLADGRAEQVPATGLLYNLAADMVEWLGAAAIAGALLAALACGVGARYVRPGPRLARLTGRFAVVAALALGALGVGLTAFNPYPMPVFDSRGITWLVLVLLLPLSAVVTSATRCLRTA